MKFKYILIFAILAVCGFLTFNYLQSQAQKQTTQCLANLLTTAENESITIKTLIHKNQVSIEGVLPKNKQETIMNKLYAQCGDDLEIFNQMETPQLIIEKSPNINFYVNTHAKEVTIRGQVATKEIQQQVIQIISANYPDMLISHMLQVDKSLRETELSDQLALTLTQIQGIELADISIKGNQLILKGLVRDFESETQKIAIFNSIFEGELQIINQLDRVVKNNELFEELEIEIESLDDFKLPEIE